MLACMKCGTREGNFVLRYTTCGGVCGCFGGLLLELIHLD